MGRRYVESEIIIEPFKTCIGNTSVTETGVDNKTTRAAVIQYEVVEGCVAHLVPLTAPGIRQRNYRAQLS